MVQTPPRWAPVKFEERAAAALDLDQLVDEGTGHPGTDVDDDPTRVPSYERRVCPDRAIAAELLGQRGLVERAGRGRHR